MPAGQPDYDDFAASVAPTLLRDAHLLTGDHHLAHDLVREVLLRLFVAWGRSGDWISPHAYARTALYRTLCSWRGRRWTGELPFGVLPERAVTRFAVHGPDGGEDGPAQAALLRLPRRQRAALVARFDRVRGVRSHLEDSGKVDLFEIDDRLYDWC